METFIKCLYTSFSLFRSATFHYVGILLICAYVVQTESDNCIIGGYNLSRLDTFSPWFSVSDDLSTTYNISICKPLPASLDCGDSTAVCMHNMGGNPMSTGNFVSPLNYTTNEKLAEMWIMLQGGSCQENPDEKLVAMINLKCGKTFGSPKFLDQSACISYFEWHTFLMCDGLPKSKVEVPCYTHNRDGEIYDLTPLIKTTGAYLVEPISPGDADFYINVCRDITPDSGTVGCPLGSAACSINSGVGTDWGHPQGQLKFQEGSRTTLLLNYSLSTKPVDCLENPFVEIYFLCPAAGKSKDPALISGLNCHYIIEWQTEHACVESSITSKTCKLTKGNVNIDLTPLKKNVGESRSYQVTVGEFQYFINICDAVGIPCPDEVEKEQAGACQTKTHDSNYAKVLGRSDHQLLRYADGELTLRYSGGDKCDTKFQRNTVINFHCNKTAGLGFPSLKESTNCTFIFDWYTRHACLEHPVLEECRVYNGKRYDLSPLSHKNGTNWNVMHSQTLPDLKDANIVMNVCHDLLKVNEIESTPGSAIAIITKNGEVKSLGGYNSEPYYNSERDAIQLNYTLGSSCPQSDNYIQSIITFICKPGDLTTGPVFTSLTENGCLYEFEWQTAAACVLNHASGNNCKVSDDVAGIDFDLSPLIEKPGHYYSLTDPDEKYDYYINVCDVVTGTSCDGDTATGMCQVTRGGSNDKTPYNCGQANSELLYYDGMITLMYKNGDAYHVAQNSPPANRSTKIAFICDPDAGLGSPKFVDEKDHAYLFNWWTMLACPKATVECIVVDQDSHKQYDLSSLSKSGNEQNWYVDYVDRSNVTRKIYINVCRTLNPVLLKGQSVCDSSAAACQTRFENDQEMSDEKHRNLGQVSSKPTINDKDGLLSLKYIGPSCSEHGNESPFITTVKFICKPGALNTAPDKVLSNEETDCEYTVLWETEAACPVIEDVAESDTEPCTFKDKNLDYVFNLKHLMKNGVDQVYHVPENTKSSNDSSRGFKMNICGGLAEQYCGKLEDKPVAVCHLMDNGKWEPLAGVSTKIEYVDGHMKMFMEGIRQKNGLRKDVTVTFMCDRHKFPGEPKFYHKDGSNHYIFVFRTALACPPEPVDCMVQDSFGNQYDLTPLSRPSGNWQVVDTRTKHSDIRYYINICRPINTVTSCPGGPIGGCVVSLGETPVKAYNMGYIQAMPIVADDGTLTIHYVNGDICHKGKEHQHTRITRIILSCSAVEHNPVFISESNECEYLFEWNTPAACSVVKVIGSDCQVTHPLYNYKFDMSPLRKSSDDYHVTSKANHKFLINVCGALNEGTGVCQGAGACRTDPSPALNIGKPSSSLVYDTGELILQYSDGSLNRTTSIRFLCDHSKLASKPPTYIDSLMVDSFVFEWPTHLACSPYHVMDCSYKDVDNNQYDLSALSLPDGNYDYIDEVKQKKFILNVCRSLVNRKGELCPLNSAACAVDLNEKDPKKKYEKLGEVGDGELRMEAGKLLLIYRNGDPCNGGKNKTSTFIVFICDKDTFNMHPAGHFKVGECENHFVWSTAAACPINSQIADTIGGNCTVRNPSTGYEYNLNSLSSADGYTVFDQTNHKFQLNICQKLSNSTCPPNTGVCQIEVGDSHRSFAAGNANGKLQINDGIITLNYTGGDLCHGKFARNTVISFVCSEGSGRGEPKYIDASEDCTYYFSWHTDLVCEEKVKCSVDVNNSYSLDLSPLIDISSYHLATSSARSPLASGASFYVSICRPLIPISGVLCPPGASACMTKPGQKPLSLGQINHDHPPYLDPSTGKIVLDYTNGGKCENNPNKNISTKIIFNCQQGHSHGEPRLEEVDGCTFHFEWDTNIVCPVSSTPTTAANCVFYDSSSQTTFNLSSLQHSVSNPYVLSTSDGKLFHINVCGSVSQDKSSSCSDSSVCEVEGDTARSFGRTDTAVFSKEGQLLKMTFTSHVPCSSKSNQMLQSQIIFDCDRSVEKGEPELLSPGSCYYIFLWRTQLVCPPIDNECILSSAGHIFDLRALSKENGSWNLKDASGNSYWINICQRVYKGPSSCPPIAGACRKTTSGHVDMLGRVSAQRLYLDMKDGAKTIVLEYSQGQSACSYSRRRSDNTAAKTILRFRCGSTVGGPVFIPSSPVATGSCDFNFEWNSTVACTVKPWENITEVDGIVSDNRIGVKFNLNKLYSMGTQTTTEKYGGDTYAYAIDLNGTNPDCRGDVVCQHRLVPVDTGNSYYKPTGKFAGRQFYIKDDVLEGEYPTDEKCPADKSHNIRSIIQFVCNRGIQKESPRFSFRSKTCTYHFIWETKTLCAQPSIENQSMLPPAVDVNTGVAAEPKTTRANSISPKTVVAIVAVFLVAIVVCILLVIFHKKERRVAFKVRVKNLIPYTRFTRSFRYTELSQSDEKEENWLLSGGNQDGSASKGYHDDSDDDMLNSL